MARRITGMLLALLMLAGCGGQVAHRPPAKGGGKQVAGESAGAVVAEEPLILYGRSFLSAVEQELYDWLLFSAANLDFQGMYPLPPGLEGEGLEGVLAAFRDDQPRYDWVEIAQERGENGQVIRLALPELGREGLEARMAAVEEAAAEVLELDLEGFDYVVAAHDWMVEEIRYDTNALHSDIGNLYGGAVEKWAVCDGFAKTFQYLMMERGISCVYFRGESARGLSHAWNAVELDGGWYYVDVTWDAVEPYRRHTYHRYLGVTLEDMLRERSFDPLQYPELPQGEDYRYNYHHNRGYGVFTGEGDVTGQMARAFVNQLGDMDLPQEEEAVYLEIRVFGSQEEYENLRDYYIKELFGVLGEMDDIIRREALPIRLRTEGTIRCNYSDGQRILILFPYAATADLD